MDKWKTVEHFWLPLNLCWLVCFFIIGLFQLDLALDQSSSAIPYSHTWAIWGVLAALLLGLKIRKIWYHFAISIFAIVIWVNILG